MRNATVNKVIRMLALNFVIITLLPPYYFRGAYTTRIYTRCGSSWFDRQSLDVLFGGPNFGELSFHALRSIRWRLVSLLAGGEEDLSLGAHTVRLDAASRDSVWDEPQPHARVALAVGLPVCVATDACKLCLA